MGEFCGEVLHVTKVKLEDQIKSPAALNDQGPSTNVQGTSNGSSPRVLVALFRDAPGFIGRLIRWQTRSIGGRRTEEGGPVFSGYSHAALVFYSSHWIWELNEGWASIEAREFKGVRRSDGAKVDEVLERHPKASVDLFEVRTATGFELKRERVEACLKFAVDQIGKGYDYTMVARFISRRQASRRTSGKWFCSELVFAALQKAGVDLLARTEPWEVSPGQLARSPLLKWCATIGPAEVEREERIRAELEVEQRFHVEQLEGRYGF